MMLKNYPKGRWKILVREMKTTVGLRGGSQSPGNAGVPDRIVPAPQQQRLYFCGTSP